MNPHVNEAANLLIENFTQKRKTIKHEESIAAQIMVVEHYFTTAWQMLNDSHNNTGSKSNQTRILE